MIVPLIALIFLVLLSAFFSGAETALTSMTKLRVKRLVKERGKRAKILTFWLENPNQILVTILVSNNIVNITASVLATTVLLNTLPPTTVGKAASIATGGMILLILVFGEITPKTFAKAHAPKMSLLAIRPLKVLSYALTPIVKVLTGITTIIIRVFGGKIKEEALFVTEEELLTMVDLGEEEGALEEEEREMIHSVFEFGDTLVKEVMTARNDIIAIPETLNLKETLATAVKTGYSRIPVFEDSIDNITGVVYTKDLLKYWQKGRSNLGLKGIIRPPYHISETMKVSELLQNFQRKKVHMAIVVNEYGKATGLVTIEDLLEELVGEIEDEYDIAKERG